MPSAPDVALVSAYPANGVVHGGTTGVASYAANLVRGLTDEGARVHVVAPRDPGQPERSVAGDVTIERGFVRGARAGLVAAAAARRSGAPVVHVQFELFLYGGASALPGVLAALRRPRTVVTVHQVVDPASVDDAFVRLHGIRVPAPFARLALAGVQRGLGTLPEVAIVHERAFAEQLPSAVVIPHGIERVAPADRTAARAQLGVANDRLLVLCFGFVAPYKGLDLACSAAELAGDAVALVVAGGDHPRYADGGYSKALRARFGHAVDFRGYVAEEEIPTWFGAADLVLLPYPRPHATSGALALALAYGRSALLSPELARAVGAAPAVECAPGPQALAVQLRRLASDRAALAALEAETRRLAKGRSWREVARRHLALYEEVSHAGRAPAGRAARR